MLILFCVPIIHFCLINIFISDAQGKYSTFNANEWMGRTSKQRKWPSLNSMWGGGYVCLTCYCCSWLVCSASRLERASFGQQCWARVLFASVSFVGMAVTWIARLSAAWLVVSVPGIFGGSFWSGVFVQVPGISRWRFMIFDEHNNLYSTITISNNFIWTFHCK